jgi:hypothetical protein
MVPFLLAAVIASPDRAEANIEVRPRKMALAPGREPFKLPVDVKRFPMRIHEPDMSKFPSMPPAGPTRETPPTKSRG